MLALVTLPDPTQFMTDVASWSSPFFDNLYPIAILAIGFMLGGLIVYFLITTIAKAVKGLIR